MFKTVVLFHRVDEVGDPIVGEAGDQFDATLGQLFNNGRGRFLLFIAHGWDLLAKEIAERDKTLITIKSNSAITLRQARCQENHRRDEQNFMPVGSGKRRVELFERSARMAWCNNET